MVDTFNIVASIPGILGATFLIVGAYSRIKTLRSPLWLAKQISSLSIGSIFVLLMLGYGMILRSKEVKDQEQVLFKFQREIDKDMELYLLTNQQPSNQPHLAQRIE